VLANFLEVNQFLAVELMQLKKISIAQALAVDAQALDLYTQALVVDAQALDLFAQALAVDSQALDLFAQALAVDSQALDLYMLQSFQFFSSPSK
jgi:hypothetical protein